MSTKTEFVAGDITAIAVWNATDDGEHIVLSLTLQNQLAFSEFTNVPQDATEYYSFKRVSVFLVCSLDPFHSFAPSWLVFFALGERRACVYIHGPLFMLPSMSVGVIASSNLNFSFFILSAAWSEFY